MKGVSYPRFSSSYERGAERLEPDRSNRRRTDPQQGRHGARAELRLLRLRRNSRSQKGRVTGRAGGGSRLRRASAFPIRVGRQGARGLVTTLEPASAHCNRASAQYDLPPLTTGHRHW